MLNAFAVLTKFLSSRLLTVNIIEVDILFTLGWYTSI